MSEIKDNDVTNQIPKILIKTGPMSKPNSMLTKVFDSDIERFGIKHLIYFNDHSCHNFIKDHLPELVLNAYTSLIPPAYRADLFRYCALYILGGVYMDLTNRFVKNYDIFDSDYDMIIVDDRLGISGAGGIQISFIACRPGLEFMRFVIENVCIQILSRHKGKTPLDLTGPQIFRRLFITFFGCEPKYGNNNYNHNGNNYKIKMDIKQTSDTSITRFDNPEEEIISIKSLGEKEHRNLLLDPNITISSKKALGIMHHHHDRTYRKNDYAEYWRQNKIFY